jgi:hypothetical protein
MRSAKPSTSYTSLGGRLINPQPWPLYFQYLKIHRRLSSFKTMLRFPKDPLQFGFTSSPEGLVFYFAYEEKHQNLVGSDAARQLSAIRTSPVMRREFDSEVGSNSYL